MAELNTLAPMKWDVSLSGAMPTLDSSDLVNVGDIAIDTSMTPNSIWKCLSNTAGNPSWAHDNSSISNTGMWTLVERWEPTAAATSHTFSNLNGDVDREYMIKSNVVANGIYTSIYIYPNAASGDTFYSQAMNTYGSSSGPARGSNTGGWQLGNIDDSGTGLSTGESYIRAKSGKPRVSYMNWSTYTPGSDNGGLHVRASGFGTWLWNDTTTNITSMTVSFASGSNGFNTGSNIELYKLNSGNGQTGTTQGMWTLKERWAPTSNATSHTFNNLNGDSDRSYMLRSRVVSNQTSNLDVLGRFNADSGSNYTIQVLDAASTSASESNFSSTGFLIGWGATTSDMSFNTQEIYAASGKARMALGSSMRFSSTASMRSIYATSWSNTADNITSLTVLSTESGGIGVGTEIELWVLNPSATDSLVNGSDGATVNLTANRSMFASEVGKRFVYTASTAGASTFSMITPPANSSAPVWITNNSSYTITVAGNINVAGSTTFSLLPDCTIKLKSEGSLWRIVMERWEPSSAATNHTFAALNGNIDRQYKIRGRWNGNQSSAYNIQIRPNGDSGTNYIESYLGLTASHATSTSVTGINLMTLRYSAGISTGEVDIDAASGVYRNSIVLNSELESSNSNGYGTLVNVLWKNTADNITSIDCVCTAASGILAGSYIELWKTGEIV